MPTLEMNHGVRSAGSEELSLEDVEKMLPICDTFAEVEYIQRAKNPAELLALLEQLCVDFAAGRVRPGTASQRLDNYELAAGAYHRLKVAIS